MGTHTVYPKKYAHGFCVAVLCCSYTLTDFPISIRLTSLALWQSNDCPSASKATLMNMDKYFMWIHYEWLHNHNKAKHNKTVCIFLGIYCSSMTNHCKLRPHFLWRNKKHSITAVIVVLHYIHHWEISLVIGSELKNDLRWAKILPFKYSRFQQICAFKQSCCCDIIEYFKACDTVTSYGPIVLAWFARMLS